jgi:hypothetical protein
MSSRTMHEPSGWSWTPSTASPRRYAARSPTGTCGQPSAKPKRWATCRSGAGIPITEVTRQICGYLMSNSPDHDASPVTTPTGKAEGSGHPESVLNPC